ncbi:MAG: ABC transporter ATP-binding protein [Spirochaetales bacterium]|nr:ABC transporter ATP-binding protein [Spirochaetales bacterium]
MENLKDGPILQTRNLTKSYGKSRGIIDVDIEVFPEEIYGFIGPNGAGKSTAIRAILGLIFPDSGDVRLFGEDGLKNGADVRRRIGFVPSDLNFYDGLNVRQLLNYSADFYGDRSRSRIDGYAERLKLDTRRKIDDLSLGNRKKVAIIQALLHRPELLILDEPTSGLDPLIQSRFYEILREEQSRGCTIFFSSHTLSEVERLCSRVAIIREGRIVKTGQIDELRRINMKRFRLLFRKGVSVSESDLGNVKELTFTEGGAEGLYTGDVKELMSRLAKLPIEDAVIEDPGLEEIFMHYYQDSGVEE